MPSLLAGGGGEGWCAGRQVYVVGVNARVWTDVRECGRACEGGWCAGGQVCVVDVQVCVVDVQACVVGVHARVCVCMRGRTVCRRVGMVGVRAG